MQKIFKCLRCVVFGIFIVCNAAVTSVAVWNHGLSLSAARNSQLQIDVYLAFVGCLGLVLIFPLIFIELAQKDFVTGRIWFECLWVCLFWMLYLGGAAAVTVTAPNHICDISDDECTSTQALKAFTWIAALILLLYFSLLSILTVVHSKYDPRIWRRYIRKSPWSGSRQSLSSAPTSPFRSDFLTKPPSIAAPRPKRAVPPVIYAYRSGIGSEYEIEHYRPPSPVIRPEPALAVASLSSQPEGSWQPINNTFHSLYPQHLQSTVTIPNPSPQAVRTASSPSPLGDWPRTNVVMEPVRKKRKNPGLVLNLTEPSASRDTRARRPSGDRSMEPLAGNFSASNL